MIIWFPMKEFVNGFLWKTYARWICRLQQNMLWSISAHPGGIPINYMPVLRMPIKYRSWIYQNADKISTTAGFNLRKIMIRIRLRLVLKSTLERLLKSSFLMFSHSFRVPQNFRFFAHYNKKARAMIKARAFFFGIIVGQDCQPRDIPGSAAGCGKIGANDS